jgi:hypothetical protein
MKQYMKATLLLRRRDVLADGIVVEMVIWRLPRQTADRPHGLKYRLQAHKAGLTLVRYDNEAGKGDHRHYGRRETVYAFTDMETLIEDFIRDVERLGGQHG